jgi:hypothetical protein
MNIKKIIRKLDCISGLPQLIIKERSDRASGLQVTKAMYCFFTFAAAAQFADEHLSDCYR